MRLLLSQLLLAVVLLLFIVATAGVIKWSQVPSPVYTFAPIGAAVPTQAEVQLKKS